MLVGLVCEEPDAGLRGHVDRVLDVELQHADVAHIDPLRLFEGSAGSASCSRGTGVHVDDRPLPARVLEEAPVRRVPAEGLALRGQADRSAGPLAQTHSHRSYKMRTVEDGDARRIGGELALGQVALEAELGIGLTSREGRGEGEVVD